MLLHQHLVEADRARLERHHRARQVEQPRAIDALAHDRALAKYSSMQDAVRSQYWMLVVMVGFTSLGLWLLSAVNT